MGEHGIHEIIVDLLCAWRFALRAMFRRRLLLLVRRFVLDVFEFLVIILSQYEKKTEGIDKESTNT